MRRFTDLPTEPMFPSPESEAEREGAQQEAPGPDHPPDAEAPRAGAARPRLVRGHPPHLRLAVVLAGGSIEKLKEILGHYSVVVTERYTHLRPDLFADRELDTIPFDLRTGRAPGTPKNGAKTGPRRSGRPGKPR